MNLKMLDWSVLQANLRQKKFAVRLYNIVSNFVQPSDTGNENYSLIFFNSANMVFMLYLIYLEVFGRFPLAKVKLLLNFKSKKISQG